MNNKNRKTLKKIFEEPVRSDIAWSDIERLFKALGAIITEKRGSRVGVSLGIATAVFHRPHPEKETDKGALRSVQRFLDNAGIDENFEK